MDKPLVLPSFTVNDAAWSLQFVSAPAPSILRFILLSLSEDPADIEVMPEADATASTECSDSRLNLFRTSSPGLDKLCSGVIKDSWAFSFSSSAKRRLFQVGNKIRHMDYLRIRLLFLNIESAYKTWLLTKVVQWKDKFQLKLTFQLSKCGSEPTSLLYILFAFYRAYTYCRTIHIVELQCTS